MAITTTINDKTVMGNKVIHYGTIVKSGTSLSEDVATGLGGVDFIDLNQTGSGTSADILQLNETFPTSTGDITVVFATGTVNAVFKAEGKR